MSKNFGTDVGLWTLDFGLIKQNCAADIAASSATPQLLKTAEAI
jgi:hypothetical protein